LGRRVFRRPSPSQFDPIDLYLFFAFFSPSPSPSFLNFQSGFFSKVPRTSTLTKIAPSPDLLPDFIFSRLTFSLFAAKTEGGDPFLITSIGLVLSDLSEPFVFFDLAKLGCFSVWFLNSAQGPKVLESP